MAKETVSQAIRKASVDLQELIADLLVIPSPVGKLRIFRPMANMIEGCPNQTPKKRILR